MESQLQKWITQGLSTKQIADRLGASKTWVISELKKTDIKIPKSGRLTNPNNYRHHNPPFGFVIRNGQLHLCQKKQRICRLVVQWRDCGNMSFNAIAKKLKEKSYKNGAGTNYWDHKGIKKIYDAWGNKYKQEKKL